MSDNDNDKPNPLVVGVFCPTCEIRVDDKDFSGGRRNHPCPICGWEAP